MGDSLRDRRRTSDRRGGEEVIDFAEEVSTFSRLSEALARDFEALDADEVPANWRKRTVSGRLTLAPGAANPEQPELAGTVETTVDCVCQRTLTVFAQRLEVNVDLSFDGESDNAWELEDGSYRLIDVVDELLVMALPLVPRRMNEDGGRLPETEAPLEENKTIRPFADLRSQMDEDKS